MKKKNKLTLFRIIRDHILEINNVEPLILRIDKQLELNKMIAELPMSNKMKDELSNFIN